MELPKLKDQATIGDVYGPAMELIEQADADTYFDFLVRRMMRLAGETREKAEGIVRQNLGYYAGYYSNETRARVERLFRCEHPVFGSVH